MSAAHQGTHHSAETRAKISLGGRGKRPDLRDYAIRLGMMRRGVPLSAEVRARMSAGSRRHTELAQDCACFVCRHPASPTRIERILREVILAEFPEVIPEKRFGPYRVDAYLPPPYHLAFEADGKHWHEQRHIHDIRRDAYLLREWGLPIVRLSEAEIMEAAAR